MFAAIEVEWLIGLLTAVGVFCTVAGAALAKLLPVWTQHRAKQADDERKAIALETKLKREAVHETRDEYQALLNRKELDIQHRDKVIRELGEKVDEMYDHLHKLMNDHRDCLIQNEKLSARVAILEVKLGIQHGDVDAQMKEWEHETRDTIGKAVVAMPTEGGGSIVSVPPGGSVDVHSDDMKVNVRDQEGK
jgi:hypothetical protein